MDLRQTKQFAQYLKSRNWLIEKIGKDYVFIRKIPLTPFSILKLQRPEKIDFEKIDQLAKKHRSFQIIIEPREKVNLENLKKHGFKLSRSPFLPTKTIQLDISQAEEKILAQMKKDARYSIKKAQKENLLLMEVKSLDKFHQAWKKAVGLNRHVPSLRSLKLLKRVFGQKANFLAITFKENILAETIILLPEKTAYYYYAFTSKEGRQKLAQYLLVWQSIKLAKKEKMESFDFEGIYDERFPIKTWKGFSHFKKSFRGKEIDYPGCFTKGKFPF